MHASIPLLEKHNCQSTIRFCRLKGIHRPDCNGLFLCDGCHVAMMDLARRPSTLPPRSAAVIPAPAIPSREVLQEQRNRLLPPSSSVPDIKQSSLLLEQIDFCEMIFKFLDITERVNGMLISKKTRHNLAIILANVFHDPNYRTLIYRELAPRMSALAPDTMNSLYPALIASFPELTDPTLQGRLYQHLQNIGPGMQTPSVSAYLFLNRPERQAIIASLRVFIEEQMIAVDNIILGRRKKSFAIVFVLGILATLLIMTFLHTEGIPYIMLDAFCAGIIMGIIEYFGMRAHKNLSESLFEKLAILNGNLPNHPVYLELGRFIEGTDVIERFRTSIATQLEKIIRESEAKH